MSRAYSPSEVSRRAACPLAYAWRHVAKRSPTDLVQDDTGRRVGMCVHRVLAEVAAAGKADGVYPSSEEITRRVRRWGLPPAALDNAITLALSALRALPDPPSRIVAVERGVDVELLGEQVGGRVDMLARGEKGGLEVWDWKTEASPPRDTGDLALDVQVVTYLAWARYQDLDAPPPVARWVYLAHGPAIVTVRWKDGMAAWLGAEVRQFARGRGVKPERAPARPGRNCGWCDYLSGCDKAKAWLGSPVPSGEGGIAPLALAYAEARDRAKALEAAKKSLGERLMSALGREKRAEADGVKVTRVRTTRQHWPPEVVARAARSLEVDAAELWERVGTVNSKALEATIGALPRRVQEDLEELREERSSEHVRVKT